MFLNLFWFILFFTNRINGFQQITNKIFKCNHKCKMYMIVNDKEYLQDLDLLQKYKFYFPKENYNNVIQDLLNNKLSKIYVDNKYTQMVTVDNLPQNDNVYNHYHLTDVNPIVIPNLVEKSGDLHVPLHFVSFIPQNIVNIQNLAGEFLTLASTALPILFLLSFLASLSNAI